MTRIKFIHKYEDIISVENLLEAWKEFLKGKRHRQDVQEFQRHLMFNIFSLHKELKNKTYKHSPYEVFNISDPKPRIIHKAKVGDRLLHRAVYRILYPFFDRTFISDSYSCRNRKGTHKALKRFRAFTQKVSCNHTKTAWILKCDIRKFFASVNQEILLGILRKSIQDKDIILLLTEIVKSFPSIKKGIGLPLGNLTSQLLVNIYMNEFDQWIKHVIRAKYYIRYADDFVILSQDKDWLFELVSKISDFLYTHLKLSLHPDKVYIKTLASGVDFLGWIHFSDHTVLRNSTKKRMFRKLKNPSKQMIASYLELLKYGNTERLTSMF